MSATTRVIEERIHLIEGNIVTTVEAIWEESDSTPERAAELLREREKLSLDRSFLEDQDASFLEEQDADFLEEQDAA